MEVFYVKTIVDKLVEAPRTAASIGKKIEYVLITKEEAVELYDHMEKVKQSHGKIYSSYCYPFAFYESETERKCKCVHGGLFMGILIRVEGY